MYQFVRNDLPDDYGILALQDKLLEIMVDIDAMCREHKIDYCLMAGSALGARRHQGFIPWDDDIDIYMTPGEYQTFRDHFHCLGDKYYLQEWGRTDFCGKHMITLAKVRLNHSELQESTFVGWKMHQGIFVDIFILHHCPAEISKQKKQYLWAEAAVLKGLSVRGYKKKNFKDGMLLGVAKLLPRKILLPLSMNEVYRYQGQMTGVYSGFIDTRRFSRAVFPADIMFPTQYVPFEQVQLKVPADNDAYLKIQFGEDYMTPPAMKDRPIRKHAAYWSANTMDKNTGAEDYSDEEKLI